MPEWIGFARRLIRLFLHVKAPLIILILASSFQILHYYGLLPSVSGLAIELRLFFDRNGLPVIGIVSFLENIVGFNTYFPGSVVILTAMSLTAGNSLKALVTFLIIYVPATIAYHANYFIGRFNSAANNDRRVELTKHRKGNWIWFFTTFWHPQFASLTSFMAGSTGMSYRMFMKHMLISSLVWNSFWGLTMYHVGLSLTKGLDFTPLIFSYILLWLGWEILKYFRKETNHGGD